MKKQKSIKILKGNVTVTKILENEELKDFADKIISEDIDEIILVYRGKGDNSIHWATTIKDWAMVFGSIDMVHMMMQDEWNEQRFEDKEEEN